MLCVTRKETETITVGKAGDVLSRPIVIEIAAIYPQAVQLRCDADKSIRIERTGNVAETRADRPQVRKGND
jgi:sRNA-binding carbon storage regulator CsrA